MMLLSIAMVVVTGCQNDDTPTIPGNDEESSKFGTFHNEVIKNIFDKLPSSLSRSNDGTVTISAIKEVCVEEATVSVLAKDAKLQYEPSKMTIAEVSSQTVESIQNAMSNEDREVVDGIVSLINQGSSLKTIKDFIAQCNLPNNKKEAAYNFLDTYISSKQYWEDNGAEWIDYINANVIVETGSRSSWYDRVSWGNVAFSDAYYAWYGTLSSGCNVYVGAGAAAVGSVASVLNQL